MYEVSDAYKVAVASRSRKSKMRATITIGDSTINLDDNDIIKDSVYITNQCTNGSEYEYGCVYAAECGLTIKSAVNRYKLYDAELKLYWSLWTGSAWEEIPLGVFYISEPNRINDKISIKALDGMIKLDERVRDDLQGTLTQLIPYIAEKCNVKMAQTKEELSKLVNSNVQYSVYANKVNTYRDLLAYVCMMSACFATFDRFGKLKIVPYATNSSLTLGRKQRFTDASFSDYTTSFVGIKARFIANENYAPYEHIEAGNGLVLDMGDNPIVRGLPETKRAVLEAVFSVLKDVAYTPFELETLGNPAIELGDLILNEDVGNDRKLYVSPVTYYYWTYRGKHKLSAVGGNPKLSGVKNKEGKQIDSLESDLESKTIAVNSYVNADAIVFKGTEKEIATLNYATTDSSKMLFLMTVRLNVSLDGLLILKFYIDGKADTERVYKQYVDRGEHIITITDLYTTNANDRGMISVGARMEYFESDNRRQEADIQTFKNLITAINTEGATVNNNLIEFPAYDNGAIDKTVATCTIAVGGVKAILYGQGIAGEGTWDGTLNIVEEITRFGFSGGLHTSLKDVMSASIQVPNTNVLATNIGSLAFNSDLIMNVVGGHGISDYVAFDKTIVDYTFNTGNADKYTYDAFISTNNMMFSIKSKFVYESVEQFIDEGKMCSVSIDFTGIDVGSVVVSSE